VLFGDDMEAVNVPRIQIEVACGVEMDAHLGRYLVAELEARDVLVSILLAEGSRCPTFSNGEVLHPHIGRAKLVQSSQAVGVDAVLRLDGVVQTAVPGLAKKRRLRSLWQRPRRMRP
jgi:hypothetical protein